MSVENRVNQGCVNRDRGTLNSLLADEFFNITSSGSSQNKSEYLANVDDSTLRSIRLTNQRVVSVNKGTITIAVTKYYLYWNGRTSYSYDTDAFIWRDGRWQMLYSHSARTR